MATHSSVLAWRIPGTGEPGGLPSLGSQSRTLLKWLSSSSSSNVDLGELRDGRHEKYSKCVCVCVCVHARAQSRPPLCNPMDCSPPDSSVHGISQARILEWIATSSSRESSQPRFWAHVSCIGRWILYHWATWEALDSKYQFLKNKNKHPFSVKRTRQWLNWENESVFNSFKISFRFINYICQFLLNKSKISLRNLSSRSHIFNW